MVHEWLELGHGAKLGRSLCDTCESCSHWYFGRTKFCCPRFVWWAKRGFLYPKSFVWHLQSLPRKNKHEQKLNWVSFSHFKGVILHNH